MVLVEKKKRSVFYQELVVGRGDVWRELQLPQPSHQEQPLFSNIYRVDW